MDADAWISTIRNGGRLTEPQVLCLLDKLSEVLFQESTILSLDLPISICGDIHGQLYDLFELFRISGGVEANKYLFLGDYVDRGYYSLETFCYLAALKLKYPDRIYLLRGNHESRVVNQLYGFQEACISLYGHTGIWTACNEVFDLLPIAALVGGSIFCCHGGLSPNIKLVEQIPLLERNAELPSEGPICDLCWSDPDEGQDGFMKNQRGAGYLFGKKEAEKFIHNNKLELIARAHQLAMNGYEYHFGDEQLVTVWSAPNYMYRSGNVASVMKIDPNHKREFVIFKAVPSDQQIVPPEITSQYFA